MILAPNQAPVNIFSGREAGASGLGAARPTPRGSAPERSPQGEAAATPTETGRSRPPLLNSPLAEEIGPPSTEKEKTGFLNPVFPTHSTTRTKFFQQPRQGPPSTRYEHTCLPIFCQSPVLGTMGKVLVDCHACRFQAQGPWNFRLIMHRQPRRSAN